MVPVYVTRLATTHLVFKFANRWIVLNFGRKVHVRPEEENRRVKLIKCACWNSKCFRTLIDVWKIHENRLICVPKREMRQIIKRLIDNIARLASEILLC